MYAVLYYDLVIKLAVSLGRCLSPPLTTETQQCHFVHRTIDAVKHVRPYTFLNQVLHNSCSRDFQPNVDISMPNCILCHTCCCFLTQNVFHVSVSIFFARVFLCSTQTCGDRSISSVPVICNRYNRHSFPSIH